MAPTPDVLTRAETAERLGVTTVTITRWTEDGRLTAVRSDPWLYARVEVERLAAELAVELKARLGRLEASA
jgi:predicted site-specific integrase-resolvase